MNANVPLLPVPSKTMGAPVRRRRAEPWRALVAAIGVSLALAGCATTAPPPPPGPGPFPGSDAFYNAYYSVFYGWYPDEQAEVCSSTPCHPARYVGQQAPVYGGAYYYGYPGYYPYGAYYGYPVGIYGSIHTGPVYFHGGRHGGWRGGIPGMGFVRPFHGAPPVPVPRLPRLPRLR